MADWKWEDAILLIPKLKRHIFNKLRWTDPVKLANRLAIIFTAFTILLIIISAGFILRFGANHEVPIISSVGNAGGIKYLAGADKFDVTIDSPVKAFAGDNFTFSFIIRSYKQVSAKITVYLRPYFPDDFVPSYKYERQKILEEGVSDANKEVVDGAPSNSKGPFEICIIIDDNSFFSRNKYAKCPSTLEIIKR